MIDPCHTESQAERISKYRRIDSSTLPGMTVGVRAQPLAVPPFFWKVSATADGRGRVHPVKNHLYFNIYCKKMQTVYAYILPISLKFTLKLNKLLKKPTDKR